MTCLPNTGGKKNTFSPVRIQAEQLFLRTLDQSDITFQRGNVRRGIPMKGQRSFHGLDIRTKCREIVEQNFEPQLQLKCSREWYIRNKKKRKATFKYRLDFKNGSLKHGHQVIDAEVQQRRQHELSVIMEEYPPEKVFNFDESRSFFSIFLEYFVVM